MLSPAATTPLSAALPKPLQDDTIRFITDAIPACLIVINTDYVITTFNKGAENIWGVTRDHIIGRTIMDVVQEYMNISSQQTYIVQALEQGTIINARETRTTINGRNLVTLTSATPLVSDHGEIIGALNLSIDITHIRETERRMSHLESLAAIGQLAAGTVHEIRNPLTSIKGFTQLIATRATRNKQTTVAEYCGLIVEEINHINNIVSDFLTLSRPPSNTTAVFDVVQMVSDVLAFMYGESLLSGITVTHNLPHKALYVEGSMEKLKEVLINICRNGFQAMQPGGVLTISVSEQASSAVITICDTGCGMTPETMKYIFKPFFTTKENGTGLGLSICQRIVRDHRGDIKVTSRLGQGSTFTLTLPLKL